MKSWSIFRLIFFFIVAIFALNFVVVLVYFPLSPSSTSSLEVSPLTLKLQSLGAFGDFQNKKLLEEHQRQQQLAPRKADGKPDQKLRTGAQGGIQKPKTQTKESAKSEANLNSVKDCESYGCPVYPAELTTPLTNQTVWKTLVEAGKNNQLVSNFAFATESFAVLSQQGASHKFNQDRGLYVSPFLSELLLSTTNDTSKSFLTAIFDGHGDLGHKVAQELVEKVPVLLGEKLKLALSDNNYNKGRGESHNIGIVVDKLDYDSTDRAIRKALNETFLEVNEKGDPANFFLGGSTASITLRWGSRLYVANTGDSETIVVSASPPHKQQNVQQRKQQKLWSAKVEYATRRDKANQPEERARIEKLGGKIHINAKGFDPRVVLHSEVAHDTIGLAMSRSIGDWEWKAVGVTAEPTIDVIDLTKAPLSDDDKTIFLVAASDGFWEERKKPFYAARLAASFGKDDEGNLDASLRPLYHLYDMIQKITTQNRNGYRDDITVIIVNLT